MTVDTFFPDTRYREDFDFIELDQDNNMKRIESIWAELIVWSQKTFKGSVYGVFFEFQIF